MLVYLFTYITLRTIYKGVVESIALQEILSIQKIKERLIWNHLGTRRNETIHGGDRIFETADNG